ncbi:EAL domain-containing protein [Sulfurimonas sp. SAG-AH-194-L11]|nr:EAL domain-containing protein [Sulfurimonas sp. SAG-AH-194-L11]MDF1877864.1 EAL domain-containing protein [Sulfurimonas sp. SAG-AH-194-L11]
MQSISIGRQPIIDAQSELCSYEILYKGSSEVLSRYSSASIINNVLNKFGTHRLLGDRRAFVKIDEKFLLHDIIFSIPGEFFIFSLLDTVPMSERVVERIEQLYEKGYLLSVEHFIINADTMYTYDVILEKLSFIKVNINESSPIYLKEMIEKIKTHGITVVADEVVDFDAYEKAKDLGCDWFQGYFFAKPKILENAKYEPSQIAVLKLYNLLMQDVNIDEIAKEFEINHEITVQLLQFINSGTFSFRNEISSIHHVLTLVGRIPLGQWLMLMIYSKAVTKDKKTPLMLMVKNRTQLMENVLKVLEPKVGSNMLGEAYFVGVLSLIDTVFGMDLETILAQIRISSEVRDAILEDSGILGEIFKLVRAIERFDYDVIYAFEKKNALEIGTIEKIVFQSMHDVNNFERPQLRCL